MGKLGVKLVKIFVGFTFIYTFSNKFNNLVSLTNPVQSKPPKHPSLDLDLHPDMLHVIDIKNFQFVLNNNICNTTHVALLILVLSGVTNQVGNY